MKRRDAMQTGMSDETVFGDMNGPLTYWGPARAAVAATAR
jgi:hypothetical protein